MDIVGALLDDRNMLDSGTHKMLFPQFRSECQVKRFTEYGQCSICCEEYDEESELAVFVHPQTNVPHHYHMFCVRNWFLKEPANNCPTCRTVVKCPAGFWTDPEQQRARRYVEEERVVLYNQTMASLEIDLHAVGVEARNSLVAMNRASNDHREAVHLYENTREMYIAELTEIRNVLADRVQHEIPEEQQPA